MEGPYKILPAEPVKLPNRACLAGRSLYSPSMFSVNQMAAYNTLLEGYNIMRNSSSELIETKWTKFNEMNYRLRSQTNNELKVPEKPKHKCTGFT